jgi:hypothetical protein
MAGRSHWSLAAELATSSSGERLSLDIACRVSTSPGRLGSRYRLGPDVCWDAAARALRTPGGTAFLRLDDLSGQSGTQWTATVAKAIELRPAAVAGPLPATIRWKFAIEVP